jgi:hypothetical protein
VIKLVDGPAEGAYAVKRAPLYLRAILNTLTGEKDVLDQLTDRPDDFEEVWVYKLEGEAGMVHLNFGSGRGGHRTGFYATGTYHHLPDVVGGELRSEMAWRTWVAAQVPGGIDMTTGRLL